MESLQVALVRARLCPKPNGNGQHHESSIEMRLEALEKAVADITTKLSTPSFPQKQTPVKEPEPQRALRPSIAKIKNVVCGAYNVTLNDIDSAQRGKKIVWPRQIAVYLACRLTPHSLTTIGRQFGGRDHTTVISSRNKVAEICASDEAVRNELIALEAALADGLAMARAAA